MNTKAKKVNGRFNPVLFFILAIFIGLIVIILFPLQESSEGQIMNQACKEVREYSTMEACNSFQAVLEVVNEHKVSPESESEEIMELVKAKILEMEEEAKLHTNDRRYYEHNTARILNSLALSELIDADYYRQKQHYAMANRCLDEAKHYMHDAMTFLGHDEINAEQELLKKVMRIDVQHTKHGHTVEECIEELKALPHL